MTTLDIKNIKKDNKKVTLYKKTYKKYISVMKKIIELNNIT